MVQERVGAQIECARSRLARDGEPVERLRTGDFAWHSAARNAEKSCAPSSASRASRIARERQRAMVPADARVQQRGPHRRVEQQVAVVRARRAVARVEIIGDRQSPSARAIDRRQQRIDAAHPRRFGSRVRSVSKCTTCTVACTPLSVRPAATSATGAPAISASARSSDVLHARCRRLRLPAVKRLPSYSSRARCA